MPYAWQNLGFGENVSVVTIKIAIKTAKNGIELINNLANLNIRHKKWDIVYETKEDVIIRNIDSLGNESFIECEKDDYF